MRDVMSAFGTHKGDREQSRRLKLPRPYVAIYPILSPSFVSLKIHPLKIIIIQHKLILRYVFG